MTAETRVPYLKLALTLFCTVLSGQAVCAGDIALPAKGEFAQIDVGLVNETITVLSKGSDREKEARIKDIKAVPEKYAPPVFYVLSAVLFDKGEKDEAAFWFYAGQVRARFDANRCADVSAREAVAVLNQEYGPVINQYAFRDIAKLEALIPRVVEWDRKTPHKYDHRWINLHGMGAISAGLGVSDADRTSAPLSLPKEQWDEIEDKTRSQYLESLRKALAELKKRGDEGQQP